MCAGDLGIDGATELGSCARLQLWAAACGLSPAGIEDDCAAYRGTDASGRFGLWVDCISAGGCVAELADERFAACDDSYVPDAAYLWVDACSAIAAFNQDCFGIEPTLAGCLLEAQRYTPTSYMAYADCLAARDCADSIGQAACNALRQEPDGSDMVQPCQDVIAWADRCAVTATVGADQETCAATLARFTPASAQEYADCVASVPCEEAGAASVCVELLELAY